MTIFFYFAHLFNRFKHGQWKAMKISCGSTMLYTESIREMISLLDCEARKAPQLEHCLIGVLSAPSHGAAQLLDFVSLSDIGGKLYKNKILIPAQISYKLLRFCANNIEGGLMPIIAHNHKPDTYETGVSFSKQDMMFATSLIATGKKLGYADKQIYVVSDFVTFEAVIHEHGVNSVVRGRVADDG